MTIRSAFEEVARDDEGACWAFEERTCVVPAMDGLAEQVSENLEVWKAHCDECQAREEAAEAHARAVAEAADGLPDYQAATDAAVMEVAELAAITEQGRASDSERLAQVEAALLEIGDLVGGEM